MFSEVSEMQLSIMPSVLILTPLLPERSQLVFSVVTTARRTSPHVLMLMRSDSIVYIPLLEVATVSGLREDGYVMWKKKKGGQCVLNKGTD